MQGNRVLMCYNGKEPAEGGWKMAGKRCIISLFPMRRGLVAACAAAVLLAVLLFALLPGRTAPQEADARLAKAGEGLTDYTVTLRLDDREDTLAISETVLYRNDTGDTLSTLMVRTWLNAFRTEETSPAALEELYDACYPEGFSPGGLALYDVLWNGERAAYAFVNEDQTALEIQIPALENGRQGELTLRCVAQIPACCYRTGKAGRDYQLGNVLPLLSLYQDGAWRADAYSAVGDPFLSECANFHVTLHMPEGYVPACSAPLTKGEDGAWRGDINAARDFCLCLSPDYVTASGRAGETAVYSLAKTAQGAKRALDYAKKALETYAGLYGAYPYPAFTVCQASFPFSGMEYPGLCMIGADNYREDKADTLELVVAHETAHQWFYALVGSDQALQPWQDEALCEYAMLRYVRARYGQGSYETLKYYRVDSPMREKLPGSLTPGSPIDYFGSLTDYRTVVYGRGAALLLALDELLPGGADGFLKAYGTEFAFRFATRADFEECLNRYAKMDLSPLLLDYLDTVMD